MGTTYPRYARTLSCARGRIGPCVSSRIDVRFYTQPASAMRDCSSKAATAPSESFAHGTVVEVAAPGLDESLAVQLIDLLERLQAIRHEARANDVHARALAAPNSAISSIVCGPSHCARPNTDWKVAVREPHCQAEARLEGGDRVAALGAVGVPGLVHGDRDRVEGHDDAVPRQEVGRPTRSQ